MYMSRKGEVESESKKYLERKRLNEGKSEEEKLMILSQGHQKNACSLAKK